MPATDQKKNVKKSEAKKKEALGVKEYNAIKLKSKTGEEEYKKQQAEYMKEYRAKQKQFKKNVEKKQKSLNTLTDAMKERNTRKELQTLAITKANETANKLTEIGARAKRD
jgi:hypothetical protein